MAVAPQSYVTQFFNTVFDKLYQYTHTYPEKNVCGVGNFLDTYTVQTRKAPLVTEVLADTMSAPDGYVAAELCYVANVGIGWVGICNGHSDGKVYLGADNGYGQTSEYRLRFFSDNAFMSPTRCVVDSQRTAGVALNVPPAEIDDTLPMPY